MNNNELYKKIELGKQSICNKTILHTAPHHDDILLGYFPYVVRNLSGNIHHVLYVTSGANGVSDRYLAEHMLMQEKDIQLLDHEIKQELKSIILFDEVMP